MNTWESPTLLSYRKNIPRKKYDADKNEKPTGSPSKKIDCFVRYALKKK